LRHGQQVSHMDTKSLKGLCPNPSRNASFGIIIVFSICLPNRSVYFGPPLTSQLASKTGERERERERKTERERERETERERERERVKHQVS
jgi:hypothetical protein